MIRALDPKLNPATAEIQNLRNQLTDRDKQILHLEVNPLLFSSHEHIIVSNRADSCVFDLPLQRQCEQNKLREYEEKLMVTAWYNKVEHCSVHNGKSTTLRLVVLGTGC